MISGNSNFSTYHELYNEIGNEFLLHCSLFKGKVKQVKMKEEGRKERKKKTYDNCHLPDSYYQDKTRSFYWCDKCRILKARKQYEVISGKRPKKNGGFVKRGISLCLPICLSCRVKKCHMNKRLRDSF